MNFKLLVVLSCIINLVYSKHLIIVGNDWYESHESGEKPEECAIDTSTTGETSNEWGNNIGVQCCSMDGLSAYRKGFDGGIGTDNCLEGVDYNTAKNACESRGDRLCSADEVRNNIGAATGCYHDAHHVWTSDSCGGSTLAPTVATWYPTENTKSPSATTLNPTLAPILAPTSPTSNPTADPTAYPTPDPTFPTSNPSSDPTNDPTITLSLDPSPQPTFGPTVPTLHPTMDPTTDPTSDPSAPTLKPSIPPTLSTNFPTKAPLSPYPTFPTVHPTMDPTNDPTSDPSETTLRPSIIPTSNTINPTKKPLSPFPTFLTMHPTMDPTSDPITSCIVSEWENVGYCTCTNALQQQQRRIIEQGIGSDCDLLQQSIPCYFNGPQADTSGISAKIFNNKALPNQVSTPSTYPISTNLTLLQSSLMIFIFILSILLNILGTYYMCYYKGISHEYLSVKYGDSEINELSEVNPINVYSE